MIKMVLATGAVAASTAGISATRAPQAMAIGNGTCTSSVNGNGASQSFGDSETRGDWSPQFGLVQGSLKKPCAGLPAKVNAGSLLGVAPVAVQDVSVLSSPQNQQCTENSTQAKGDEPLSHIRDTIPVLSGDGASTH
ncbi:rodlin [Streptomyces sp. NPDC051020]|uniref:rodlin n=1 Tax=Streptomyces sp. NPDC051020 TaxID=3155409 RepID=UPI00342BF0D4